MLTLLQGIHALGLPLGPRLEEDGLRPQDAWNRVPRHFVSSETYPSTRRLPKQGLGRTSLTWGVHRPAQGRATSHKGHTRPPSPLVPGPTAAPVACSGGPSGLEVPITF